MGWYKECQDGRNAYPICASVHGQQFGEGVSLGEKKGLDLDLVDDVGVHEGLEDRNMVNLFAFAASVHGPNQNLGQIFQPLSDVEVGRGQDFGEERQPFNDVGFLGLCQEGLHDSLFEQFFQGVVIGADDDLDDVAELSGQLVTLGVM